MLTLSGRIILVLVWSDDPFCILRDVLTLREQVLGRVVVDDHDRCGIEARFHPEQRIEHVFG